MLLKNKCFCGSNASFVNCCQPFITKSTTHTVKTEAPQTPEQLMRSRFSAYATNNSQYIYDTYAKSSQAEQSITDIAAWSDACIWIALRIHPKNNEELKAKNSAEQFVEFSAYYIYDDSLCELRENSRFVKEKCSEQPKQNTQWRYLDGNIITNNELSKISRKAICPCNHYPSAWSPKQGLKYKHCCAKN